MKFERCLQAWGKLAKTQGGSVPRKTRVKRSQSALDEKIKAF